MDELLRESACTGNLEAAQKLLGNGSAINSQNSMNGWYERACMFVCASVVLVKLYS